jgi:hypothetical protein
MQYSAPSFRHARKLTNDSAEMIAAYLSEVDKSGDVTAIAMALAAVERARHRNEAPKE